MTNDRGEYRSVRRVLLDGPDFQKLPERARWLFLALKLNTGPTGIEVCYPEALVPQIAQQTGIPAKAIRANLDALESAGWIKREANILWIVGQLEHDPHMSVKDEKHRKAVQRHIASLPRLAIVRAFVQSQLGWFPPSEGPSSGLGWAIEGPSKGHRSTENKTEDKTRTEKKKDSAGAKAPRDSWLLPASREWEGKFGAGSFPWGEAGKHLKPLHTAGHLPAAIAEHLGRYLAKTETQYVSLPRFAKTFGDHAAIEPAALVDEFGVLTPLGDKETRAA